MNFMINKYLVFQKIQKFTKKKLKKLMIMQTKKMVKISNLKN